MEKLHLRAYAHIGDAVYEVFIREKVIKITSIILSFVAFLLLIFNGQNIATFINSVL